MEYNTSAIRRLLKDALDDISIDELCFDHFRPVFDEFARGMGRAIKIQQLISYCDRYQEYEKLLELIREINPKRYSTYESTYRSEMQPMRLEWEGKDSVKRIEFMGNYSNFTPEQLARAGSAAIHAMAAELNAPPEIFKIISAKLGSLVVLVEMPEFAFMQLTRWHESNDTVISDLGIVTIEDWPPSNCLGVISTALSAESTQDEFYFWIDDRRLVEATQLVRVTMPLPKQDPRVRKLGKDKITVIGVVEQVRRQSESRNLGADHARYGGQIEQHPILPPSGFTYAHCRVLELNPALFVPLQEGTEVYLASEEEAGRGYSYPAMEEAKSDLVIGLLRNGGTEMVGSAKLDTRYILGEYGGHVNVTGVAGTGTKTSFLMVLTKMLVTHARQITREQQDNPLYIVPIVFNVKGNDLMWLNRDNHRFDVRDEKWNPYREHWGEALFKEFATPFSEALFYSYSLRNGSLKGSLPAGVKRYSWGLQDVIEWGVEKYLFSSESRSQELIQGVLEDAFYYITKPKSTSDAPSGRTVDQAKGVNSFKELVEWLNKATLKPNQEEESEQHYLLSRQHSPATIKASIRRLNNMLSAARGILESESLSGDPPQITHNGNRDPIVIDIDGLEEAPQRFVVAAIIEKIKRDREAHADRRQRYIIVLDELNRFAPRGSHDEVSQLFEHVAAQLRSQGVILFGAQQKASGISPLVWENAATKVLGRTGAVELANAMWHQVLPEAARMRATTLGLEEKLILQDVFNYPMHANIPMTPWATRKEEIGNDNSNGLDSFIESKLHFEDE